MEDGGWSRAGEVGCHAVVLCSRQGTSVTHSLNPCFTSFLAPPLHFPLISSHRPPQSSKPSSKSAELADTVTALSNSSYGTLCVCVVWFLLFLQEPVCLLKHHINYISILGHFGCSSFLYWGNVTLGWLDYRCSKSFTRITNKSQNNIELTKQHLTQ